MSAAEAIVVPEVDADTLARLIMSGPLPVLVDYVADHCVWCTRIEPVLLSVLVQFDGQVQAVKLNLTRHPAATTPGGIRATPTLALYRGGRLIMSKSGMMQRAQLQSFLEYWLDPENEGLAAD